MFIDEVKIKVISWKWWDWLISWRREKYIPKWWPRWWDGWDGWNVIIRTNPNLNTLSDFRHKKVLSAQNWWWGWTQDMHWANWEDLIINVPVWTIIKDINTWEIIADLNKKNQSYLLVEWWRWWFGNSHFCSSTRQAPAFAELWDVSQEKDLQLELKLVADIWIIWVPSAWKSTLIWNITNVKPKIWDYPFTTLTPNLWVLDRKWKSLVMEDVPWLIPWASKWKWLWIEFLKHIERCGVIIHLLDLSRLDKVFSDYDDIRKELEYFSSNLATKEEIIVFSKADLLDTEMKQFILDEFTKKYNKENLFIISSATREGIDNLVDYLIDNYSNNEEHLDDCVNDKNDVKVYNLTTNIKNPKLCHVELIEDMTFRATWVRLEQIVRMTDFDNLEWVMRVYHVIDKLWVLKMVEEKLDKIKESNWLTNDFYFEWSDEKDIMPKILIWDKILKLEKLKFNL